MVFGLGGPLDLLWHEIFGIEVNIEAALSPTHLLLAVGAVLMVSGPLRAAWQRTGSAPGWSALGPAILSLTFTLSVFTLLTQIASPFVNAWAGQQTGAAWTANSVVVASTSLAHPLPPDVGSFFPEALGIASVVLQTGLLMGFVLLALRRWTLPFGAVALVFTLDIVLLSFMKDQYRFIPVLFGLYFLALALTEGLGWAVELWTGSMVFAGVTGLVLSCLLAPPEVPSASQSQA
jgi:hypothetical protein